MGAALAAAVGCSPSAKSEPQEGKPPVAVETARIEKGDLNQAVDVVGTLSPKFEAAIRSEYSGVVTQVLVTEWVPVKKGQTMARLDSREAEASLLQVKAQASRDEREYERALKLKEAGLMTAQGLEDAKTRRDASTALLQLAQARLDKSVIRSPMDGVVAYRGVSVGDYVENMGTPKPMFRIVDNRLFDLTVTVPSGKIHSVEPGQLLTFTTDAVPGRTFEGRVAFINPSAEENSRAVQVMAEVPNPTGELRADLFVKGKIHTLSRSGVLLAPRSALLTWDLESRKAEIFALEDGLARRRSVETGADAGDLVEVVSGLSSGDTVVTRGAFNLRDGDRVAVVGSRGA
jgi:membrane fusion protein (multidrug efflux system)